MLQERDDIVALDSAILQHPKTWEASGHLAGFTDPMVDCRNCGQRFRADHLGELACPREAVQAPRRGPTCDLTEARDFNLMFETTMGPVKDSGATVYLRPETAQGIFVNFKNVLHSRARSRRSASRRSASRFATRSRRATSSSARASSSRWRWSSSCRPTRRRSGTSTGSSALRLVRASSGIARRPPAAARARPRRAVALLVRHRRRRVPLPDRAGSRARGHRQPRRLRPHAAREVLRREARVLRPADQGALRPARHRAGGGRRPRDARVPRRRLRRGRGRAAS